MLHSTPGPVAATLAAALALTISPAATAVHATTAPATAAHTAAAATANTAAVLPDWTRSKTVRENDRARAPKVIGLRYAEHARFDRVVVDVKGRQPGYRISYVKKLTYDGSGNPVPLKGRRSMAVNLFPAYAHNGKGENLYDGPRLQQLKLPTLRGIAFTGDFEGQVSLGFTTRRKAPYRIFTLTNPTRIVIDWRHPVRR